MLALSDQRAIKVFDGRDSSTSFLAVSIPAIGSFYGGFAGGVSVPLGGLEHVNETGGTAMLLFGWQPVRSVLGARIDASYSRYRRAFGFGDDFGFATPLFNFTTLDNRSPNIWNFNLDLKVAIPGIESAFGHAVTFQPYLLGGGGFVTYDHLPLETADGAFIVARNGVVQTTNGVILTGVTVGNFDTGWHTDWGWNAGGGLAWRFANKELFIESRVLGFNIRHNDLFPNIDFRQARQVPIVFGMNFY